MNFFLMFLPIFAVNFALSSASFCGCKHLRPCYKTMLDILLDRDEETCIENAAIGTSTLVTFLKALRQFCGDFINVISDNLTFEGRHLYEVILSNGGKEDDAKPTIVIEAGQQAGTESVSLALFIVEQLVACAEYTDMISKVRWVILPCTNPDGQEYARFNHRSWKKNLRISEDKLSYGVDISRNFDSQWGSCDKAKSGFSSVYPGPAPASENETVFIKAVLTKYKNITKAYISMRRDGHSVLYPYGYTKNNPPKNAQITKVAGEIAFKVNQRAGGVQTFVNESIYDANGKSHCGHSVDYAYDLGVPLAYEMRVFLGSDYRIMSKFQTLPRGYEASLRAGYFSGIKELYNVITKDKSL